jgi:hypothetical protein
MMRESPRADGSVRADAASVFLAEADRIGAAALERLRKFYARALADTGIEASLTLQGSVSVASVGSRDRELDKVFDRIRQARSTDRLDLSESSVISQFMDLAGDEIERHSKDVTWSLVTGIDRSLYRFGRTDDTVPTISGWGLSRTIEDLAPEDEASLAPSDLVALDALRSF